MDTVPETSFEDVDGTFGYKEEALSPHLGPTSATSATTDSTTFSEKRYSSSTELASDEDILNYGSDFEEYQRGDDVHLDIDSRFKDKSDGDDLLDLQEQLEKKLSINLRPGYESKPKNTVSQSTLRQPKSMMNLASRRSGTGWSSTGFRPLPNSRSYMNLKPRNKRELTYKTSMPSLQNNNTVNYNRRRSNMVNNGNEGDFNRFSPFLRKNYNSVGLEFEDDEDARNFEDDFEDPNENFDFNERVAYPDYLDDEKGVFEPTLKLSPSQYEIEHDDSLLTPQLYHRKHHDTNPPLDSYREKMQHAGTRVRTSTYRNEPKSVRLRLKTIKQEIDHNSPMKRGKMKYNPKDKKWEGNEDVLKKFENVENIDRKAFLIKNKRSSSPIMKTFASSTKINVPSQHGKIVGKMKFDEQNLRWLRVDGEDADPFEGITDVLPKSQSSPTKSVKFQGFPATHSSTRSQSHLPFARDNPNRFASSDSTRFHSLNVVPTTDPTFQITSKQLERFYREENKWSRKVGRWFILGSTTSDNNGTEQPPLSSIKDRGYMYEIRNMVLSSAHN